VADDGRGRQNATLTEVTAGEDNGAGGWWGGSRATLGCNGNWQRQLTAADDGRGWRIQRTVTWGGIFYQESQGIRNAGALETKIPMLEVVAATMMHNIDVIVCGGGDDPPPSAMMSNNAGRIQSSASQCLPDAYNTRPRLHIPTSRGRRAKKKEEKTYFGMILQQGGKNKSILFCVVIMDALTEWMGKLICLCWWEKICPICLWHPAKKITNKEKRADLPTGKKKDSHFVPPGNLLGIWDLIPRLKKMFRKMFVPIWTFLHDSRR
jgi:hypothetical protein